MAPFNNIWFSVLFLFPSLLYGWAIRVRNALYRLGLKKTVKINVFVVSVGNITVGGTGKTPLVIFLAEWLTKQKLNVAVLSRGYKRKSKLSTMVSDGKGNLASAQISGDEPFLIARRAEHSAVYVGKNRIKTAGLYLKNNCDIVILDDGFQHLRIKRDLDIVCMNADNPWGNGRMIPAGPLREPLSGMQRADLIVLMHSGKMSAEKCHLKNIQRLVSVPVIEALRMPKDWIRLGTENPLPINSLQKKKVLAFAGIANPDSFRRTLAAVQTDPDHFISFRDHHWYSKKDLDDIAKTAEQHRVQAIVTTEKDAVRIPSGFSSPVPIFILRIEIQMKDPESLLKNMIMKNKRLLNKGSKL